jgi:hypothetical protein
MTNYGDGKEALRAKSWATEGGSSWLVLGKIITSRYLSICFRWPDMT